jgi:amino acid transporter
MANPENDNQIDKQKTEKVRNFFIFLIFTVLDLFCAFFEKSNSSFFYWVFIFGALMFFGLTIISLMSVFKNWTGQKEDKEIERFSLFLFGTPIVLTLLFITGILLTIFFGWLSGVPLWAIIIIFLLL